jgi:hypothetical protein
VADSRALRGAILAGRDTLANLTSSERKTGVKHAEVISSARSGRARMAPAGGLSPKAADLQIDARAGRIAADDVRFVGTTWQVPQESESSART